MADLCDDQVPDEKSAVNGRRWITAAMLALVLHGTAVAMVIKWTIATPPVEPPATVTINFAPFAAAPVVPDQDATPGPQMTEAQPSQQASDEQTEEIKLPDDPAADIALPPPSKSSVSKPRVEDRKVENEKSSNSQKHVAPRTTALKPVPVRVADHTAAPSSASADKPAMSVASWRNLVAARLSQFPTNSNMPGLAMVAFVVDRSGRVLSSSLRQSSGDRALDAQAVALPRRASPVPPPPESERGNTITVTTPVRFR